MCNYLYFYLIELTVECANSNPSEPRQLAAIASAHSAESPTKEQHQITHWQVWWMIRNWMLMPVGTQCNIIIWSPLLLLSKTAGSTQRIPKKQQLIITNSLQADDENHNKWMVFVWRVKWIWTIKSKPCLHFFFSQHMPKWEKTRMKGENRSWVWVKCETCYKPMRHNSADPLIKAWIIPLRFICHSLGHKWTLQRKFSPFHGRHDLLYTSQIRSLEQSIRGEMKKKRKSTNMKLANLLFKLRQWLVSVFHDKDNIF